MHEMSLCQNIMEIIDQQKKKHEIHEVTDIWLEIGALSCVEQSAVEFCFEIMRKDTVAENCQLHFIHLPAIAWCWQCQKEVEIEAYQDCCPHCHSACLQRRSGTEFRVKEISVK